MDTIVANNISNIATSTKMVLLTTNRGEIIFDISKAFRSNDIFINITKVTEHYNKRFRKWIENKSTKEFIRAMEKEMNAHEFGQVSRTSETKVLKTFTSPLIQRKAGRYGGTYIHENILLDYLMWLDMGLKVQVYLFLKRLYKQITITKTSYAETKTEFSLPTDSIRDIYIPAQGDPIVSNMLLQ